MGHFERTLIILLISAFVILPIFIPFLVMILHKYDDKADNFSKHIKGHYGTFGFFPRTIIYAVVIGVMHSYYYLYPDPQFPLYAIALSAGVLLFLIFPKFLFILFVIAMGGIHFLNIFYTLDPGKTAFFPVTFSVVMLITVAIISALNKSYNLFRRWYRTFNISPAEMKKYVIDTKIIDGRVLDENNIFYSSKAEEDKLHMNSALYFEVKDKIRNFRSPVFRNIKMDDPVEMSRAIEIALFDLERRYIRSKRDFIYFILVALVIYLIHFAVMYLDRLFF